METVTLNLDGKNRVALTKVLGNSKTKTFNAFINTAGNIELEPMRRVPMRRVPKSETLKSLTPGKALQKAMVTYKKFLKDNPERAGELLKDAGIITAKGNLTKHYRPNKQVIDRADQLPKKYN